MNTKQSYNFLLAQKLIEEFEKRNMEAYYAQTRQEALKLILDMLPKGALISWGGSQTLHEIGLPEALKAGDYKLLDPNSAQGGLEKTKIAEQALLADYYFMSSNAISQTGEMVNIDGIGNRVAALAFGPKHVVIVAGMNKVTPNLDAAILRAQTYASQMILLKFKNDYASIDQVAKIAEKSGSHMVVTSMSVLKDRIKIVLVGEDLGF